MRLSLNKPSKIWNLNTVFKAAAINTTICDECASEDFVKDKFNLKLIMCINCHHMYKEES